MSFQEFLMSMCLILQSGILAPTCQAAITPYSNKMARGCREVIRFTLSTQIVILDPRVQFWRSGHADGKAKCKMQNAKCKFQHAENRTQHVKRRMSNAEREMQNAESALSYYA